MTQLFKIGHIKYWRQAAQDSPRLSGLGAAVVAAVVVETTNGFIPIVAAVVLAVGKENPGLAAVLSPVDGKAKVLELAGCDVAVGSLNAPPKPADVDAGAPNPKLSPVDGVVFAVLGPPIIPTT